MRGKDEQQLDVFSYVSPEQRVPQDHPLRMLRGMTHEALKELQPRFNKLYAKTGRPSIAPEKLSRALLLQALYSVRSERMLMEQLDYNLLFRWFVGLNMDDSVWDVTVFTKNRERLLAGDIAESFFQAVLQQARERSLLSDEHFTVDGTLLEAWASVKSYQRKDAKNPVPPDDPGNATVDFHGEKRSNQTHASKTDPDAKMARKGKGKEAKLSYNGNLLVENRNGLIVNTEVFEANGTAERDAALVMLEQIPGTKQVTVGGDKAYDTSDFVAECRNLNVTPHVAQNLERPGGSAIDARTTQHVGYAISQRKRKRIEECFGWLKTIPLLRKVRHRGIFKVGMDLHLRGCRLQLGSHAKSGDASDVGQSQSVVPRGSKENLSSSRCSQIFSSVTKSKCLGESKSCCPFFRSLLGVVCCAQSQGAKTVVLEKNEGEARVRRPLGVLPIPTAEFILKVTPQNSGSKHLWQTSNAPLSL